MDYFNFLLTILWIIIAHHLIFKSQNVLCMKRIFTCFFLIIPFLLHAQPKVSSTRSSSSVKQIVEKVAQDYYQNFNNIKGDTIHASGAAIEFKSRLSPDGAIATSITKYINPNSYTWQSIMLQTEEYETAVQKYREYFRQLSGSTLKFYDNTSYKLVGNYDTPDESRAFASSILQLDGSNHDLRLFKIEIALNYTIPDWTVRIMIYEKMDDKDIRPTQVKSLY